MAEEPTDRPRSAHRPPPAPDQPAAGPHPGGRARGLPRLRIGPWLTTSAPPGPDPAAAGPPTPPAADRPQAAGHRDAEATQVLPVIAVVSPALDGTALDGTALNGTALNGADRLGLAGESPRRPGRSLALLTGALAGLVVLGAIPILAHLTHRDDGSGLGFFPPAAAPATRTATPASGPVSTAAAGSTGPTTGPTGAASTRSGNPTGTAPAAGARRPAAGGSATRVTAAPAPGSVTPAPTGAAPPAAERTPTASTPSRAPDPPTLLGPAGAGALHDMLRGYCGDRYGAPEAQLRTGTDPATDNWECRRSGADPLIDLSAACRWRYGSGAHAAYGNAHDAFSWRCLRG